MDEDELWAGICAAKHQSIDDRLKCGDLRMTVMEGKIDRLFYMLVMILGSVLTEIVLHHFS